MANKYLIEREKAMRKRLDNALKNKMDDVERQTRELLVAIYSSLALALVNCDENITHDDIAVLFAESQRIWIEHNGNIDEMIEECAEVTGIDVREY